MYYFQILLAHQSILYALVLVPVDEIRILVEHGLTRIVRSDIEWQPQPQLLPKVRMGLCLKLLNVLEVLDLPVLTKGNHVIPNVQPPFFLVFAIQPVCFGTIPKVEREKSKLGFVIYSRYPIPKFKIGIQFSALNISCRNTP